MVVQCYSISLRIAAFPFSDSVRTHNARPEMLSELRPRRAELVSDSESVVVRGHFGRMWVKLKIPWDILLHPPQNRRMGQGDL